MTNEQNHPDKTINAEVRITILEGLLQDARTALLRGLDYRAATPEGIGIKTELRAALDRIGWSHEKFLAMDFAP